MYVELAQQDHLAMRDEEGHAGGGGQDLLTPPTLYVSLANGPDFSSEENGQPGISDRSSLGQ